MSETTQPASAPRAETPPVDPTTRIAAVDGGATVVGAEIVNATAQQQADAAAAAKGKKKDAPPPPQDQTVPGGRYIVDGVTVDAEGRPLGE